MSGLTWRSFRDRRRDSSVDIVDAVEKLSSAIDIGKQILQKTAQQKTVPPACSTLEKLVNKLVPILEDIKAAGAIPNNEAVHTRMGIVEECMENGSNLVHEMCSMRRIVYLFRAPMISSSLQELCTKLSTALSEIAALLLNPNAPEIHGLKQKINELSHKFARGKFPIQAEVERFFSDWRKIVTRLYHKNLNPETARAKLKTSLENSLGHPLQPDDARDIAQQLHRDLYCMRLQKNELEEHFLRSIISLLSHQAIKPEFQCPISLDIMSEPVALVATGVVYDKRSIKEYLSYGYNKCPVTQLELKTKDFIEIPLLKSLISSWKQEFKTGTEAGGSSGLGTHSPGQNLARQSFSSGRPDSLASLSMSHASNGIASGMYNRATDETVDLETSSNGLSLSEFEIRRPYPESDAASEYPRYDGSLADVQRTVMEDNLEGLRKMLENGKDMAYVDSTGCSLLHYAAEHGSKNCLEFLLQLRLNMNQVTKEYFETPLFVAASHGDSFAVETLLRYGADLTIVTKGGWSPVHIAAHRGHYAALLCCLDTAARKGLQSAPTLNGWSTLHHAAYSGSLEAIKLAILFKSGVSAMNQTCRLGFTPLHIAASRGSPEIVGALLDAGAHVNARCNGGWSALHFAQEDDVLDVGKVLVKYGADPNIITKKEGLTALHRAAVVNHMGFIELLLSCPEVNVALRTKTAKKTAAEYAKQHGNMDACKKLRAFEFKRKGILGRIKGAMG